MSPSRHFLTLTLQRHYRHENQTVDQKRDIFGERSTLMTAA